MDLTTLDTRKMADKGSVLQLRHPTTFEPIEGMTITLLGLDSSTYRNKQKALTQDKLDQGRRFKNSVDISEMDTLSLLAACTIEWTGFEEGQQALECNEKNVIRVYKDWPWIREQVDAFIGDRANFLQGSLTA